MPIRVVAHVQARAEALEQVKEILLGFIEPTRREEGCIFYELMQNTADPCDFAFVEEWISDAALDAHLESPHLRAGVERLDGLLAAEPDIRRYALLA